MQRSHSSLNRVLRHAAAATAALFVMGTGIGTALANDYPTDTIRMLVGTAPGGGTDTLGRLIAEEVSKQLGETIVVENRPGASGIIAFDHVAKSKPDGYTLLTVQNTFTNNPAFYGQLPYDTLNDFQAIAPIAQSPLIVIAHASTHVENMDDLLEYGKENPDGLTFAVSESSTQLAVEQLASLTNLPMVTVMYKGTGPAVTDLAGGHVNFSVTTIASVRPFMDSDRVNLVGVLASERTPLLPELPTVAEQGIEGAEVYGWWAIIGPAGLPNEVVTKVHEAIQTSLKLPKVQETLTAYAAEPWFASPDELQAFFEQQVPLVLELAEKAGIKQE